MVFVFGTRYLGGVKAYNDQEIQTKFAHFCFIPLFPVAGDSLLVTETDWSSRKGFAVNLNGTSVLAAYGRIPVAVGAAAAFFGGNIILAAVLAALSLYMFFYFGRSTPEENAEREMIGSLTGVYAKADWMSLHLCELLYNRFNDAYNASGRSWKEDLKNGVVANVELMYTLALLHHAMMGNAESMELKMTAQEFFERMRGVTVEMAAAN